jgi:uncharacterized protein YhbP (UPF0306 family)
MEVSKGNNLPSRDGHPKYLNHVQRRQLQLSNALIQQKSDRKWTKYRSYYPTATLENAKYFQIRLHTIAA